VGASGQVVVVSPGRLVVEVIESEPRQR
jgi:hypothetical protein